MNIMYIIYKNNIKLTYFKIVSVALKMYSNLLLFNIIIGQGIGVIYIYNKIGIAIDYDMYINIFNIVSIKMGLLEYKFNNNNMEIILSSYRSILGFKTYIIMFLLGLVLIPSIFIINNCIFIFISFLSIILIKAFMLNFYQKHFKFYDSNNKQVNYIKYIQEALKNIRNILKYFLKLWILSIIIIAILRSSVATVILNEGYNSNISNILIILLPFPIFLYLLNFIIKYIKKEKIKSEDYYFYNDFVVERVNLYRIVYLISINYIVRNYYHTYITITAGFIFLFIIFLIIYSLHKQPSNNKVLALESKFHMTMGYISAFIGITPVLQDAISTGYIEYYTKEGPSRYIGWRKVFYKNPVVIVKGETVNIMEKVRKDRMSNFYLPDPRTESLLEEHKTKLANSPILNIAYRLKNNPGVYKTPNNFTLRPVNLFSNNKYQGSVSLLLEGRLLVVTIVRHDLTGCVFIPSYHLPDKSPDSRMKIMDTVFYLENKYNIVMPRRGNRYNGLIIFTQAESINNHSLFKVWRPTLHFTEPQQKIVKDYFHIDKKGMGRMDNLDIVDLAKDIKKRAKNLTLNESAYIDVEKVLRTSHNTSLKMAYDEYWADKNYRKIVELYITEGKKVNPNNYFIVDESPDFFKKTNFKALLASVKEEADLTKFSDSMVDPSDHGQAFLNLIKERYERYLDNNNSGPKYFEFGVRRTFKIDKMLLTKDDYTVYFSMANKGVLEGYKERQQTLGNAEDKLKLPLNKSRSILIEDIARKSMDLGPSKYSHLRDKKIYAVSIDRLTFEFYEVRTNSDMWGVFWKKPKLVEDFSLWQGLGDENAVYNCEVYSIIDILNKGLILPGRVFSGTYNYTISKHDYNLFDDEDERSIRRFMDFIYKNDDGSLTYQSDKENPVIKEVVKKPLKKARFTPEAINYKRDKTYRGVDYTIKALLAKMNHARKTRWRGHIIDFEIDTPLPDSRIKIDRVCNCCATWSISRNSDGNVVFTKNSNYWYYAGLEPRYKSLKPKLRWFVPRTKQETHTWYKVIKLKPEMATGNKSIKSEFVVNFEKDSLHGHREEQLIKLGQEIEHLLKEKRVYRRTVDISRRIRDWEVFNGNKRILLRDIIKVVEEAQDLDILGVTKRREVRYAEVFEAVEKAKEAKANQSKPIVIDSDSESSLDNNSPESFEGNNYLELPLNNNSPESLEENSVGSSLILENAYAEPIDITNYSGSKFFFNESPLFVENDFDEPIEATKANNKIEDLRASVEDKEISSNIRKYKGKEVIRTKNIRIPINYVDNYTNNSILSDFKNIDSRTNVSTWERRTNISTWGAGPSGDTGTSIATTSRVGAWMKNDLQWFLDEGPGRYTSLSKVKYVPQNEISQKSVDLDNTDTSARGKPPKKKVRYTQETIEDKKYNNKVLNKPLKKVRFTPEAIDLKKGKEYRVLNKPLKVGLSQEDNIDVEQDDLSVNTDTRSSLIENNFEIGRDEGHNDHDDDYVMENSKNINIMEDYDISFFNYDQEYVAPDPETALILENAYARPIEIDNDFVPNLSLFNAEESLEKVNTGKGVTFTSNIKPLDVNINRVEDSPKSNINRLNVFSFGNDPETALILENAYARPIEIDNDFVPTLFLDSNEDKSLLDFDPCVNVEYGHEYHENIRQRREAEVVRVRAFYKKEMEAAEAAYMAAEAKAKAEAAKEVLIENPWITPPNSFNKDYPGYTESDLNRDKKVLDPWWFTIGGW